MHTKSSQTLMPSVASWNRDAFDIEALVRRASEAELGFEYNCHMRRLYPWAGAETTKRPITEFGLVWVEVDPRTSVDAHEHDEEESFVVVAGKAELQLEGQITTLGPGDAVYIPRCWNHQMRNPHEDSLVFMDIYWDFRGRSREQVLGHE